MQLKVSGKYSKIGFPISLLPKFSPLEFSRISFGLHFPTLNIMGDWLFEKEWAQAIWLCEVSRFKLLKEKEGGGEALTRGCSEKQKSTLSWGASPECVSRASTVLRHTDWHHGHLSGVHGLQWCNEFVLVPFRCFIEAPVIYHSYKAYTRWLTIQKLSLCLKIIFHYKILSILVD